MEDVILEGEEEMPQITLLRYFGSCIKIPARRRLPSAGFSVLPKHPWPQARRMKFLSEDLLSFFGPHQRRL